jgi:hypothetical protein
MTAASPYPAGAARPTVRAPEQAFLWIRYAPRGWPPPPLPWLDMARGGLGAPGREEAETSAARLPELAGGPFDDVVWLPPVPEALRGERDRLAERLLAAGTPVLVQALPGERVASPAATVVYDLTATLLAPTGAGGRMGENPEHLDERDGGGRAAVASPAADDSFGKDAVPDDAAAAGAAASEPTAAALGGSGQDPSAAGAGHREPDARPASAAGARHREPDAAPPLAGQFFGTASSTGTLLPAFADVFSRLPVRSAALWPLIAGLTDPPDLVAAGLDALAAAGVAVVQPVVPALSAGDRRRLAAAAGEEAFDRLFHGGEPDERAFARAAAARGIGFLVPRPLPRPPLAGAGNRRIAGWLAVAADLWLRLGRPPSQGQAFFRAARWADETGYDLPALARDGNLGVVAEVDAASRALIEEAAATGERPALLGELTERYLAEETE